jgi:UDP-N-acetylglucosamine transferase subunit ALG13
MILVTVGTEKFPFNRLMNWMETLIQRGFLDPEQEEIIVQSGSCTVLPPGVRVYQLIAEARFRKLIQEARLIIAHCGEGTVNVLQTTDKPFILVPRSHRFGEHVDEHQVEMAMALSQTGVPVACSPADLVKFMAFPYRDCDALPDESTVDLCHRLQARFG